MSFLTGFKKNLNRAGQSIMQKTGMSDKTMDAEFAEEYERFKMLEQKMDGLTQEAKGYQNSMRGLIAAQLRMVETMAQFFDDDDGDNDVMTATPAFQAYQRVIQHIDIKMKSEVDDAYRTTVVEPLARYCASFAEVNEAIKRRQKKLLDYDNHRVKVRKLVERPSDDPQKLPMAEKEANLARELYENINTVLINDLPKLVALRVPYVDPSFEAMVKSQLLVGQIGYDTMIKDAPPPPPDDGDQRLDDILQQMRDLTICGNV